MKQAIKLAYRNLIGAGLRTWLNVSAGRIIGNVISITPPIRILAVNL